MDKLFIKLLAGIFIFYIGQAFLPYRCHSGGFLCSGMLVVVCLSSAISLFLFLLSRMVRKRYPESSVLFSLSIFFVISPLLFQAIDFFAPEIVKDRILYGMTPTSCQTGESPLPWVFRDDPRFNYPSKCLSTIYACDMGADIETRDKCYAYESDCSLVETPLIRDACKWDIKNPESDNNIIEIDVVNAVKTIEGCGFLSDVRTKSLCKYKFLAPTNPDICTDVKLDEKISIKECIDIYFEKNNLINPLPSPVCYGGSLTDDLSMCKSLPEHVSEGCLIQVSQCKGIFEVCNNIKSPILSYICKNRVNDTRDAIELEHYFDNFKK